jgi:hypothetical protein
MGSKLTPIVQIREPSKNTEPSFTVLSPHTSNFTVPAYLYLENVYLNQSELLHALVLMTQVKSISQVVLNESKRIARIVVNKREDVELLLRSSPIMLAAKPVTIVLLQQTYEEPVTPTEDHHTPEPRYETKGSEFRKKQMETDRLWRNLENQKPYKTLPVNSTEHLNSGSSGSDLDKIKEKKKILKN